MITWHLSIDQPDTEIPKSHSQTWMHTNNHSFHALFTTEKVCHKILWLGTTQRHSILGLVLVFYHELRVAHSMLHISEVSHFTPFFLILMYRLHFTKPVPLLKSTESSVLTEFNYMWRRRRRIRRRRRNNILTCLNTYQLIDPQAHNY